VYIADQRCFGHSGFSRRELGACIKASLFQDRLGLK
jgi:hypothetical protein